MMGHNICFKGVIGKIIPFYPFLPGALRSNTDLLRKKSLLGGQLSRSWHEHGAQVIFTYNLSVSDLLFNKSLLKLNYFNSKTQIGEKQTHSLQLLLTILLVCHLFHLQCRL